jgi:Helicase HerA, central domain
MIRIRLILTFLLVLGWRIARRLLNFRLTKKQYLNYAEQMRFLQIKMPRNDSDMDKSNDAIQWMKQNIEVMTQIYKSFYAIVQDDRRATRFGQPVISCELLVEKELIKFYLGVPEEFIETFEKLISSFFPGAVIDVVTQPTFFEAWKYAQWWVFTLTKDSALPIRQYDYFEVDPMDSVLAAYARVDTDEKLALQILVSPLSEWRQKTMRAKVEAVKEWEKSFFDFLKNLLPKKDEKPDDHQSKEYSSQQIGDIEKKSEDEWFNVVIRSVAISPYPQKPAKMLEDLSRSFSQYNYIWLNSFSFKQDQSLDLFLKTFALRSFFPLQTNRKDIFFPSEKAILNIKELASIYHFPHSRTNRNPRLVRQKFKIIPAPDDLSKEWILLWHNLYWWVKKEIRLGFMDRFRHFYIIGQTGTWKSTILRTMMNQDMAAWNGFTLIDPHGDLAEWCLEYFPKERIDDLIYRDAWNDELPFGFNFLKADNEREMDLVTNDAVDMFVQLFGHEIFGPRIQDYFRNAVLLLMEQPEWGTLVEIVRLFTDPAFQKVKLANVKNPVVRGWWEKTYGAMGDREKGEMIPYFQAKFGAFTTTPLLRNIIWQPQSSFEISDIMDKGKFLIMNLSKGKMGDINANLLGMMIVSQIRLAAFRRAFIEEKDRVPHFLYIDEFQNFITPSIESILSEARKYRLGIVIAHQYLEQLWKPWLGWNTDLKAPIFGNVGNMMCYRIWVNDTQDMEQQFAPKFSWSDLLSLDKFKWVIKMSVDMQPTPAFSINVKLPWEDPALNTHEKIEIIKQISALKYGRKRDLVEKEIYFRVGA